MSPPLERNETKLIRRTLEHELADSKYRELYEIANRINSPQLGLQGRLAAVTEAIATNVGASKAFVYVPEPTAAHGRFQMTTRDVYRIVESQEAKPLLTNNIDLATLVNALFGGEHKDLLVPVDLGRVKNGLVYVGGKRKGNFDFDDLSWIVALEPAMINSISSLSAVGSFGLHERKFLFDRMEEDILTAFKNNFSYVLLFVDADQFKQYNDVWDYTTGDKILQIVADAVRKNSRGTDVCARYGGDELCVFMPETGVDAGVAVAESIREAVEQTELGLYFTVGRYLKGGEPVLAAEYKFLKPEERKSLTFEHITISQYLADKPALKPYVIKRAAKKNDFEKESSLPDEQKYVGKQKLTVSVGVAYKPAGLTVTQYMTPFYRMKDKSGKMMAEAFLEKNGQYADRFAGVPMENTSVDKIAKIIGGSLELASAYARFCILDEAGSKLHEGKDQCRNRVMR